MFAIIRIKFSIQLGRQTTHPNFIPGPNPIPPQASILNKKYKVPKRNMQAVVSIKLDK